MRNIFQFATSHKFISFLIAVLVIGGGYFGYNKIKGTTVETRYVMATVTKGTLITSVSGSGQVAVVSQVDVKPKVSGEIISINAKNGQAVGAGSVLVVLDSTDAKKTVRDAELSLQSTEISLQKLKAKASDYSVLQAENSLTSAKNSLEKLKSSQPIDYQAAKDAKQKAEDNLVKVYEDAFNAISSTFLDLPTTITGLYDILFSYQIDASFWNTSALLNQIDYEDRPGIQVFQANAESAYKTARAKYDTNFTDYNNTSRYSERENIEALLTKTIDTTKAVAESANSESNYLSSWVDYQSSRGKTIYAKVTTYQSNLDTYISGTNTHLSALLTIQRTLQDDKEALITAENDLKELDQNNPLDLAALEASVKEKEISLEDLKAGADSLDIKSQELTVTQKKNALSDAKEKLADYSIRAPFAGILTGVTVKKGDIASSSTIITTLITKQKTAEISLNEVDVAKVEVGQKSTLTFDAVEGLEITGKVAEIDSLGTVSQGVVTYGVKIVFDTQDDRIKSGMSVSASIITEVKQDVLIVPNSAIKSQGDASYVEMFDPSNPALTQTGGNQGITSLVPPIQQTVETGISDDNSTEITSGLNEGDQIIAKTTTTSSTTAAKPATSLFGGGGGGGGVRIPGAGR
jgi:RND family efflux transporter MFP subunit